MNVQEKIVRAREAIRSISTHDDEPQDAKKALDELKAFIDNEKKEAAQRTQEKKNKEK